MAAAAVMAAALLLLPDAQAADPIAWGNDFILGNSSQNTIFNSSNVRVSMRFTADETTSLDEVAFRTGSVAKSGTAQAIVTLRADDNGVPGAVLATTASISSLPANASIYSAFSSAYTVEKGTVYHLVVEGVGVDASNAFSTGYSYNGGSYVNAFATGQPDSAQARLTSTNGGSTWSVAPQSGAGSALSAIAARNSATGATVGQAGTSTLAVASAGGTGQIAEKFIYTGPENHEVQGVTLRLKNNVSGNPIAGDLTVRLLDSSDAVLAEGEIGAAGVTSTAFADYSLTLDSAVELSLNEEYKLLLLSPGSANGSYGVYTVGTTFTTGANGAFYDGTFGGFDSHALVSGNGGSSFTLQTPYDLYFNFDMAAVPEPAVSALLIGAGLAGIGINARRRNKKQRE